MVLDVGIEAFFFPSMSKWSMIFVPDVGIGVFNMWLIIYLFIKYETENVSFLLVILPPSQSSLSGKNTPFPSMFYLSPRHLSELMWRAQSSDLPDSIKRECESVLKLPEATGCRAGPQPRASTAMILVIAECNMAPLAPLPHRGMGGSKLGASAADMGQREVN